MRTFCLTHEHVKLLRRLRIRTPKGELAVPSVDPKRPYGNSDILQDMAKILGVDLAINSRGEPEPSAERYLSEMHKELSTALAIVLRMGSFDEGTFTAEDYSDEWTPVSKETK